MSCNTAKVRITPVQLDKASAAPPSAAPSPNPEVTKIPFIDIIVPRDSGACSRVRFTLAGSAR